MLLRLLLGFLKGAVIGAGIGYGAYALQMDGAWGYVTYGAVCFVVGLFVGRPIWSHLLDKGSTIWTSVLKGLFGFGVGAGLYALAHKVLGDPRLTLAGETHELTSWTYLFGGAVGALYGAWVEVDDTPPAKALEGTDPKRLPAKRK
jgi:hypothetical protein